MRDFAPMIETSSRLLELLSLLQARREWPGPELADRLEVGVRTVRRDMERLRRLGYPVTATRGVTGGYRLGAGASLPPLLLDEEEAVAVAVGLRTAASVGVAGIEETAVRALAKLEQVLPKRLRRRVNAVGAATVPHPGTGPAVDPATLQTIATACRDSERLRFAYRSHDGTSSRRLVEPHRLVHTGRRWYLVAWDADRADWRTFRVDRIERPSADRRFVPREPPSDDIAAYVARSVSSARDRYQARVILRAPLEQVAGRVPHTVGTLEAIDERSCLLRTGSDWLGGLAVYVAEIGVDFEVLDPPEFVERVRELAGRFARATG
jgi:predicted DNA-binding transcriptional regulator YafY